MTDIQLRQLVDAVATWLRFEILCGRRGYITESALSFPMVQFLSAHQQRSRSQYPFPGRISRPGRGLSIDYALLMKRKNAPWGYIEVKWNDHLGLMGDIVRLLELEVRGSTYLLVASTWTASETRNAEKLVNPYLAFEKGGVRNLKYGMKEWEVYRENQERFAGSLSKSRGPLKSFWTRNVELVVQPIRNYAIQVGLWRVSHYGPRATPTTT